MSVREAVSICLSGCLYMSVCEAVSICLSVRLSLYVFL